MSLELTRITPEIRAAVAAIAGLSGAPVIIREIIVVETPDPDLRELLRLALKNFLVEDPKTAPETAANREPRACERCGNTYQPVRKDQKYCPNCKKAPSEVVTPANPLAGPSTQTAPGGAISWVIRSGDWIGKTPTPGQLGNWLRAKSLPVGVQIEHSARGMFETVLRKGRLTVAPCVSETAELEPEEQTPATEPEG